MHAPTTPSRRCNGAAHVADTISESDARRAFALPMPPALSPASLSDNEGKTRQKAPRRS